jgi:hypothetical protein
VEDSSQIALILHQEREIDEVDRIQIAVRVHLDPGLVSRLPFKLILGGASRPFLGKLGEPLGRDHLDLEHLELVRGSSGDRVHSELG